jgi:hypothetical protein
LVRPGLILTRRKYGNDRNLWATDIYGQLMELGKAEREHDKSPAVPSTASPGTDEATSSLSDKTLTQSPTRTEKEEKRKIPTETRASKRASVIDSSQSRNQASLLSSYHDSSIELIRKTVKFSGKEAFFGRFTPEEKRVLADIAYTYKSSGTRTSENEIARIAVNFLVNDYKENGVNSVLDRVIKALNT